MVHLKGDGPARGVSRAVLPAHDLEGVLDGLLLYRQMRHQRALPRPVQSVRALAPHPRQPPRPGLRRREARKDGTAPELHQLGRRVLGRVKGDKGLAEKRELVRVQAAAAVHVEGLKGGARHERVDVKVLRREGDELRLVHQRCLARLRRERTAEKHGLGLVVLGRPAVLRSGLEAKLFQQPEMCNQST